MHSSCSLYASLFLIYFCGFFCAFEASSDTWAPTGLLTRKLRTAIDVSSKWSHGKPLTFYTPLRETMLVNRTQCSIKVTIVNEITVATMTGGVVGSTVFQYHAYFFAWKPCKCNGVYEFKANVVFFNSEYGSYEKAFGRQDGIAVVTFPITTSGNYSNPKFDSYAKFFECEMKEHETAATVKSAYTYTWFVNFPHGGIYHTCTQKYRDEDLNKQTTALVILLPSDPGVNFISGDQFKTFLKMGDSMGEPSESVSCEKFETYKGIVVYNLPA